MTRKKTEGGELRFEESLVRLETIVKEMESGTLSLEDMIARFEEGQTLLKACTAKLNEAQKKVELLVRKDGIPATEPFDEASSGHEQENGGGVGDGQEPDEPF